MTRVPRRDLMSPRFTSLLISAFASSALLLTSAANAAPKKTDPAKEQAAKDEAAKEQAAKEQAAKDEAAKEQAAKDEAAKESATKEQADQDQAAKEKADKEAAAVAEAEAGNSPVEQPGKTYYGVGLRYRAIIVPKFMINMFGADGGRTIVSNGIGPEFVIRKDGFEYEFSGMFQGYG